MSLHSRLLISVIIPTLNAGGRFSQLLEAIKSQQVAGDIEIVVIDSCSRDGTPDLARRGGAKVLSIPRYRFNHGRTRNQAIKASKGEFVALTVQDALPTDEHWLARLLAPLLEQSDVAGSYGLQVAPPTSGFLARARSALWCEQNNLSPVKSLRSPEEFRKMPPEKRLELIRFDNVTSCIRRSVWKRLPFPERNYGEDMAWAKQVLLEGYKIAYIPTSRVWHCHERGWLYELHRAYVDGYARVQLVDWPSPSLKFNEALAVLRRMIFFLLTRKFMMEPAAIRHFLCTEMQHYDPLDSSESIRIHQQVLRFSRSLLEKALCFYPEEEFPEEAWINLLRFANVAVVGNNLGATAASMMEQGFSLESIAWNMLHWFLSRGHSGGKMKKFAASAGHTRSWKEAQKAEREFWVRYIRDELGITNRDQLVGFRLCEGRIHLCQFGLKWNEWMYSMDAPIISGRLLDVRSSVVSVFEKCRSVSVVAIDPLLEELERRLPDIVAIGKVNNCEYRSCRIQDVVETDFDIVWCNNVLDHTDDWQDIIHHFSRVLKQSGLLLLGTDVRSDQGLLDEAHISAFTADEVLAALESSKFKVVWHSDIHADWPQFRFCVRAVKR